MKIEINEEKWPKVIWDDDGEERKDGLHLGDVIKSLTERSGLEMSRGRRGSGFSDMELTAEIGLLWERVLGIVMREKYAVRPPQIRVDGIWMSPDGIGPDPEGQVPLVVEEYKATWKSTKSTPDENPRYMMQVKSYCRAIETTVAIMRIFHLNGDYKGSGPIYRVARLEFTERELDENWKMIVNEAKRTRDAERGMLNAGC